jgi:hypothetical protein
MEYNNIKAIAELARSFIKRMHNKYIGRIEYVVSIINNSGEVRMFTHKNIQEVDVFVSEINTEAYWHVDKIERIRRYYYQYKKEIIHTPLWFHDPRVTETYIIGKNEYSFLLKHKSLNNIKRFAYKYKQS